MIEGLVTRTHSNIHYVRTGQDLVECRLRGRFKVENVQVLAGDRVKVTLLPDGTGVIEDVLPRSTQLARPPVANVDLAVIVFTVREPELDLTLLDRFLVLGEAANLDILACLNKVDLAEPEELERLVNWCRRAGYEFVPTSARDGRGLDTLEAALRGRIAVFAGQSGVGKSSLLNRLEPGLRLRTGEVSRKVRRGRHTTRHVELVPLAGGGMVADTPGFTYLKFEGLSPAGLAGLFPEMRPFIPQCKFASCRHRQEPACAVKQAVADGDIDEQRYADYLVFLGEIEQAQRW